MEERKWPRIRCVAGMFVFGGALYNLIEICWRGSTHWSMFIVGGICFPIVGWIHTHLKKLNLVKRCLLSSAVITFFEFVSGCIFNLWLKMDVWNYSYMKFNILGQVCLLYTVLWGILSVAAIPAFKLCCHAFLPESQHAAFHRPPKPKTPSPSNDRQAS